MTSWTRWKNLRNPERPTDNPYLIQNALDISTTKKKKKEGEKKEERKGGRKEGRKKIKKPKRPNAFC